MARRLVLYSDGDGPANAPIHRRLLELIGKPNPAIAFVPSGANSDPGWFHAKVAHYAALGARMERSFDVDTDTDLTSLLACDAIHLSGGNTFEFLMRLRRRGMMEVLRDYVEGGGVLIGTSAGAILMTPDIGTSRLCGDQNWPKLTDLSGLGLVDFLFWPHYGGSHATGAFPIYACPDGAGIVVEGDAVELFGDVRRL